MNPLSRMLLVLVMALQGSAALAAQKKPAAPRVEYPYAGEPQYQYPRMDGGPQMKCPKGKQPYQGKCRTTRRVD